MITDMTEEQLAQLPAYVDKWIDIGLDTTDIDIEKTLGLVKQQYKEVGLEPPTEYRVYDSPIEAIREVKSEFGVDVSVSDFIYGAHNAGGLSFYDVSGEVFGLEVCDKLKTTMEIAKNCGWWLAYDDLIVLTRKPTKIKMDENNLTHCEDGLAIEYADGFGVAIWHGTRIPNEWILDKSTITTDVALNWDQIDQRQAACEILGWDNVIKELNPRIIDEDEPMIGTLIEVDIPDIGKELFLRARCGTGVWVSMPVPNDMKTALQANCWTYNIEEWQFKPEFRT